MTNEDTNSSTATASVDPLRLPLNDQLGAGPEANKPVAYLDWSLHVECPKCTQTNDLASGLHDSEHSIARLVFSNQWDRLKGWEVTCENCDHEFTIDRAEY